MWNLSLCYAFPNGPINVKLVYMLFKASADVDANMVWWFGRPTGQELYYPKLKSFGSLSSPIIVVKFPIGVCRPDRIMLTGRLTSALLYAKGLSSLRPFHLHLSFIPLNKAPKRVHPPRPLVSLYPSRRCSSAQAGTFTHKHWARCSGQCPLATCTVNQFGFRSTRSERLSELYTRKLHRCPFKATAWVTFSVCIQLFELTVVVNAHFQDLGMVTIFVKQGYYLHNAPSIP